MNAVSTVSSRKLVMINGLAHHSHGKKTKMYGVSRGYSKRTIQTYGELFCSFQNADNKTRQYNIFSKQNDLTEEDVGNIMLFIVECGLSVDTVLSHGTEHQFVYTTDKEVVTLDVSFGERRARVIKTVAPLNIFTSTFRRIKSWI
jgi:hypothetical protein